MNTFPKTLLLLLSLLFETVYLHAQTDTLRYISHTMEKTDSTVKRKKVAIWSVDHINVTEHKFDSVKKAADLLLTKCKPCWLKSYDINGTLLSEGLSFTGCNLGLFTKYYPSGQVELFANYRTNETGDWDKYRERGFCSVKEGTWLYYRDDGTIAKVEGYENGKLIK